MATEQELTDIEAQLIEDLEAGISSSTIDGTTVSYVDPEKRLKALEQLENRTNRATATGTNKLGLRMLRLKPGDCG